MEGNAALVWNGIERRLSASRIAGEVAIRFRIDPNAVAADAGRLLNGFREHGLIRPAAAANQTEANLDAAGPFDAYSPPKLEIYTDLHDLLLLDPIHDFDEAGWPVAQAEARI
jgi:hypothetical protein